MTFLEAEPSIDSEYELVKCIFHSAILTGQFELAAECVRRWKVSPDCLNGLGETPLYRLLTAHHVQGSLCVPLPHASAGIAFLASLGAHLDYSTPEGHSALKIALYRGMRPWVESLLSCDPSLYEKPIKLNSLHALIPLHLAASYFHQGPAWSETFAFLCGHPFAPKHINVPFTLSFDNLTVLSLVLARLDVYPPAATLALLKLMLEHGADPQNTVFYDTPKQSRATAYKTAGDFIVMTQNPTQSWIECLHGRYIAYQQFKGEPHEIEEKMAYLKESHVSLVSAAQSYPRVVDQTLFLLVGSRLEKEMRELNV